MQKSKSEKPLLTVKQNSENLGGSRKGGTSRDLIIESLIEEDNEGQPKIKKTYTFVEV